MTITTKLIPNMMASMDGWRDGWMDGKLHEKRPRRPLLYVIQAKVLKQVIVFSNRFGCFFGLNSWKMLGKVWKILFSKWKFD
jgi:hypothetical protein